MNRPPELWELGCTKDVARNSFVIPRLAEAICKLSPAAVVDFGCATGYISRQTAKRLKGPPISWHLLDNDSAMLTFAQSKSFVATSISFHSVDLCSQTTQLSSDCEMGFIAYTLLDFPLTQTVTQNISRWISPNGHLFVFLPDVLEDVIEAAKRQPILLDQYRSGHCSIEKLDKFTRSNVLFEANRTEYILELFTNCGFALTKISKQEIEFERIHYCVELRKISGQRGGRVKAF